MKMHYGREIDHIVYAVPDLEAAMDEIEHKMGIRPVFGGYHMNQGTKNALLHLGNRCYLELLAADPNNELGSPRWMGVGILTKPQITRWSLNSTQLAHDSQILRAYQTDMGTIQGGQRNKANGDLLMWNMIMPLAHPEVEILPFMTDWQGSAVHPTDSLEARCQLLSLSCTHPEPDTVLATLKALGLEMAVTKSKAVSITIKIETSNGIVEL